MLQIFDNLFHYKNIVTVQWIKRLKLCMVAMATLQPAKELKIQVVSWQNEIRTLDVLKSPKCKRMLTAAPSWMVHFLIKRTFRSSIQTVYIGIHVPAFIELISSSLSNVNKLTTGLLHFGVIVCLNDYHGCLVMTFLFIRGNTCTREKIARESSVLIKRKFKL